MTLQPGTVIGGRYRLTEPIAVGGMGAVWRAEDTTLGRDVAVKLLKREFTGDPTFLARFRAEARNSGRLNHPNIAAVYDYGETTGDSGLLQAYLVMELVPGDPLSHVLADRGRLSPDRVLNLVRQIGSGLGAAHTAGIVHRDIKPGNLLITPDGRVKITDFGIARATNAVPLTATGTVMGTARYLSPEQATGEHLGPGSDIYSLGVVAYEMLAGRSPFDAEGQVAQAMAHVHDEPRPLPDDVPAPVRALVMRMLAKSSSARPATGTELVREVDAAARGEGGTTATSVLGAAGTQVLPTGQPTQPPGRGAAPRPGAPGDFESTQMMPAAGPTVNPPARATPRGQAQQPPPDLAATSALPPTTGYLAAPSHPPQGPPAGGGQSAGGYSAGGHSAGQSGGGQSGGGRPRRRMTGPLIALILLVLFVAIGAAFANGVFGGSSPATSSTSTTPSSSATTLTSTVTVTTSETPTSSSTSSTSSTPSETTTTESSSSSETTDSSTSAPTASGEQTQQDVGTGPGVGVPSMQPTGSDSEGGS